MPTLREVKKRIRTVVSTKRITKAMEMVSAAKLRRAQQKVVQSRPYGKMMEQLLSHLAAASTDDMTHPFFEQREVKKKTLMVVTSDRGLCGSYNANIIRRASQWLNENEEFQPELVTVGKKGNDFFKRRRWPIVEFFGDWSGVIDYDKARDIARLLTWRFLKGETDEISLLFTRFLSTVKYRISVERYLPVARPKTEEDYSYNIDYIFEPSAEAIYDAILPNYT
ncbi:MAG: ATP synthase F1 subunit gamma, partial [Candidatus Zixiibacteriota bacterium]